MIVPLLPDGEPVPAHFHVTEVGRVQKDFIDCGGTVRGSRSAQLQLLVATDYDHRISAGKLLGILRAGAPILGDEPLPLTVEYGPQVAVTYQVSALEMQGRALLLRLATPRTACLAPDTCGLSPEEAGLKFQPVSACAPGAGCC